MSTTTTSGLDWGSNWSASATVPASSTLSTSHMAWSIAANRTRTSVESSTRKTRSWTSLLDPVVVQAISVAPIWAAGPRAEVGAPRRRVYETTDSGGPLGRESLLDDVADQVRVGLEVQLAQQAAAVGADGLRPDRQGDRDLLVGLPGPEQAQHLILARREGLVRSTGEPRAQLDGQPLGERGADVGAAGVRLLHRGEQLGRRLGLAHVARRAGAERLHGELPLRVHAHDQHGDAGESLPQLADQRNESGAGHADVQNDDVRAGALEPAQQLTALGGLADDLAQVVVGGELANAGADQLMVVRDDDPDHSRLGKVSVSVVPRPRSPVMVTVPPRLVARSRMPRSPSERESERAPSLMPRPLSWTLSSSASAESVNRTSTRVAPACRATLVRDSWKIRKAAVARPASTAGCSAGTSTRQAMPVRVSNSRACHWMAAWRPSSSSTPGRSSVAMRWIAPAVSSRIDSMPSTLPASSGAGWGSRRLSQVRSILRAVSACPSSSWISRAIRVRSASRTASSRAARPATAMPTAACSNVARSRDSWRRRASSVSRAAPSAAPRSAMAAASMSPVTDASARNV